MPLTYRLDTSLNVVFETWAGKVTAADLRDSWTRLMADPAVQRCRRNLADVRGAEFDLTGADLRTAVMNILLPAVKGRPWYSAIVVVDPLSYGTGRQFQVFAEAGIETALFGESETALAWLLKQQP